MNAKTAKERILTRLREGQRTGFLPAFDRDVAIPDPAAYSADELLGRFLSELTALGVVPHVETTAEGVRARVKAIVGDRLALAWDPQWLPYDTGSIVGHALRGASPRGEQATAEIGVTGCDAAIAETGSLVLLAGDGRPRAASLLPPAHLAIVQRRDLRFSMGGYLRDRAAAVASASSCMVVTGPSRTADIELTLTLGVHGPGAVIVVVGP